MTTYFVNAAGSDTAPYDTVAKGANAVATIKAIPWLAGDIIEVVNDGDIIEESLVIANANNITIRSYGTDGTDRETSKPTIRKNTNIDEFYTSVQSDWKIQNILFLKNNGSNKQFIKVNATQSDVTIEGNKLTMVGSGSGSADDIYAILFGDSQTNPICRNNIYDRTEAGVKMLPVSAPPP